MNREKARRAVLREVMQNFFDGSAAQVVNALLDISPTALSEQERERLTKLIEKAKQEGRFVKLIVLLIYLGMKKQRLVIKQASTLWRIPL